MKAHSPCWVVSALCLAGAVGQSAFAGESIQRGFYSHQPDGIDIGISAVRSGEVCTDATGTEAVCSTETAITVAGNDTCIGDDGSSNPCTRYGYRYDYEGANPGTEISCQATRNDGFNKRSKDYAIEIDSDAGSVFQPEWIGYRLVDRRVMLTEVHECSYQGELLTTIEYIITYEPTMNPAASIPTTAAGGGPNPDIDEPYIEEVPRACLYLTPDVAVEWVRDDDIQDAGTANEHMPILRSHCGYTAIHSAERDARLEFKFQLYDFYDVENLSRAQLVFNATFVAGGNEPTDILDNLGKISFIYDMPNDVTVVMVIIGMQGPPDGAGRPMELTASFYLRDPGRTHSDRRKLLIEFANDVLESLHAGS